VPRPRRSPDFLRRLEDRGAVHTRPRFFRFPEWSCRASRQLRMRENIGPRQISVWKTSAQVHPEVTSTFCDDASSGVPRAPDIAPEFLPLPKTTSGMPWRNARDGSTLANPNLVGEVRGVRSSPLDSTALYARSRALRNEPVKLPGYVLPTLARRAAAAGVLRNSRNFLGGALATRFLFNQNAWRIPDKLQYPLSDSGSPPTRVPIAC